MRRHCGESKVLVRLLFLVNSFKVMRTFKQQVALWFRKVWPNVWQRFNGFGYRLQGITVHGRFGAELIGNNEFRNYCSHRWCRIADVLVRASHLL